MPKYVGGIGPLEPELMIVGEAPGKHEDETGIPFVGPAGEILNNCLGKAGIKRSAAYITNVVKYRPPQNNFKLLHVVGIDLEECVKSLWEDEIYKLKPKCILAVGDEALQAVCGLTGIMKYRGSILKGRDGTKVVPMIHPAALFSHGDKGGLEYTYLKLME